MKDTALLIIDIINDFYFENGESLAEHSQLIIEPILSLKKYSKEHNMPVIYINDHYNLWRSDLIKITDYCLNGRSKTIINKLNPESDDYFLIKPKHSAFFGTGLTTLLQHLQINRLILTGIAGNICVLFTANDAYMREYELCVPSDCIASNDDKDNEYALRVMKNVLKADITPTVRFL